MKDNFYLKWSLTLRSEFLKLQQRLPQLKKLNPPNFRISDKQQTTLGYWDEQSGFISLAEEVLKNARFEIIIHIYLHEVAHMLVSELYGIKQAREHGEAFRRACSLIGIEADTCLQSVNDRQESRIVLKIHKLLAMGSSSNHHEAELALKKASELSLKHNLSQIGREGELEYDIYLLEPIYKRVPSYMWWIFQILRDHYFVEIISHPHRHPKEGNIQVFEMYGRTVNLELGLYVYDFLFQQGKFLWTTYKEKIGAKNNKLERSFMTGLYSGFSDKLNTQQTDLATNSNLVWRGDPKLDAFFAKRNPYIRRSKTSLSLCENTMNQGYEQGQQMNIHPGVKSNSTETKFLE